MKKLVSWTQTYGDKRLFNIQLLKYDLIGNHIRNKCEYIIFSFHNCPDNFYTICEKILREIYSEEKLLLLRFNNCSYLQSYKNLIQKVFELKCTDIVQIQDDQHGINSKKNVTNLNDLNDIIETYKNNNEIQHLHLYGDESIPKPNLKPIETIKVNNVEIYKYNSKDFKNYNIMGWSDGIYIIDAYLISNLLNLDNIPNDVWRIEVFLMHIYNNNVFYRWGTNKILFRASNLFGRNINNRISQTENIGRFFNETPHWKDIIQLIITTFN